jgi:outer membrane protein OmpA-like peptidoglycan-associated protein
MILKTPLILSVTGLLALTACGDPNASSSDPNARTRNGALLGAMTGVAIGATSGSDQLAKAVVGGIVGAAAGGAIGSALDRQANELRNSLGPNISVTNMGDYLIVNMPQDVLFELNSAALRSDLTRDLQSLASNLVRYPNSRVEILGHTDNTGTAALNRDLSQRRALAVADVLRSNGVDANRLIPIGRGEDQPVASNLTPEGRALNRRVEIIIRPTS